MYICEADQPIQGYIHALHSPDYIQYAHMCFCLMTAECVCVCVCVEGSIITALKKIIR
jgi:hypothetical protein